MITVTEQEYQEEVASIRKGMLLWGATLGTGLALLLVALLELASR